MKKFISALLSILLICMLLLPAYADDLSGDMQDIHWEYDKKSATLTITGNGEIPQSGPWMQYQKNIKSLVIGEGITKVAGFTFNQYTALNSVTFGPDLTEIDDCAIVNCHKVKEVTINTKADCFKGSAIVLSHPTKVILGEDTPYIMENGLLMTKDMKEVVYGIGNGKVVIPDGVEKIRIAAFESSSISEITLPESLTEIETMAFDECRKLKAVVLPRSLNILGQGAFNTCNQMKSVVFLGDKISSDTFSGSIFLNCSSLTSIRMPAMQTISPGCFKFCKKLEKVVFTEGTETIENDVFSECPKLKAIYIPDSVTSIDDGFFDYSSKPVICCQAGSYAESFANSHGLACSPVISAKSVTLSETSITLSKGKTADILATIEPAEVTVKTVEWISADNAVATVKKGIIKAVAPGECDILCRTEDSSGVYAICHITVE